MTETHSAADRVYAQVKHDILAGDLPGGAFVTEGALAAQTGVSRTPVREALLRLEGEGLVRLYPKKGALVSPPTADEARDVLEARIVIEEWAARTVWPRRAELLDDLADELEAALRERVEVERLVRYVVGPSVAVHTGLGTVGCVFHPVSPVSPAGWPRPR